MRDSADCLWLDVKVPRHLRSYDRRYDCGYQQCQEIQMQQSYEQVVTTAFSFNSVLHLRELHLSAKSMPPIQSAEC